MALKWRGKEVRQSVIAAVIAGTDETMAVCVIDAKNLAPVDTATLQGSIGIVQPAQEEGGQVVGMWGSQDVEYAIYQELGTHKMKAQPYLRPSADKNYGGLNERIRRNLK